MSMKKQSAGVLLYRETGQDFEVMLVHPGGPFWAKKDTGVWSIPKGEFKEGEEPLAAARREFAEELGHPIPEGRLVPLGTVQQASGKVIHAWALQADFDETNIQSNSITIQWPPRSGHQQEFPEVDRASWFSLITGRQKLAKGQRPLLDALTTYLGAIFLDEGSTKDQGNNHVALS
jgi:predicted NUDIX family NTP pyrophosphohydrolase